MRKTLKALLAGTAFIALTLASCTDPNSMASSTAGIIDNDDETTLKDNNGKSDKDTLPGTINPPVLSGDFIRGFDASAVDYDEELNSNSISSSSWKDTDGTPMDFFKVLANNGVNTVRFRLWVDPSKANVTGDNYWPSIGSSEPQKAGDNTLERYKRMARRAKNAGLKVMLDFHYSDYWTDPGVQVIPADWQDITTADAMADKVKSYTAEVLTSLAAESLLPDFVQVGNEIDSGILLHSSVAVSNSGKTKNPAAADSAVQGKDENLYKYLKAGAEAVRDKAPNAKIILHVTNRTNGINTMSKIIGANVDFDIVGLSFYPWESGHRTTTDLADSITKFKAAHDVMVVETSAHWKAHEADDGLADSGSDAYYELKNTKDHMVGFKNLTVDTTDSYVLATLDNSRHVIEDIMQTVKDAGGIGVCTWGGERRSDWKYGMFDWGNCQAMSNIKAFSYNFDGTSDDSGAGGGTKETLNKELSLVKEASFFEGDDYNTIVITFEGVTWSSGAWITACADKGWILKQENFSMNETQGTATKIITNSDFIDGVKTNGLYIAGENVTYTSLTVEKKYDSSLDAKRELDVPFEYTCKNQQEMLFDASVFADLDIKSVTIKVENVQNVGDEGWVTVYACAIGSWKPDHAILYKSSDDKEVNITDTDFISGLKTSGLVINGSESITFTMTVSVTSDN